MVQEEIDAREKFFKMEENRRTGRRTALVPRTLLAALLLAALVVTGSALTWQIETVDPDRVWGEDTSLALDGDGNPGISYCGNGNLKYAAWNDSRWDIQTVDGGVLDSSLALDGAGRPRVAYLDAVQDDLKYAAYDGSHWGIETVDSAGAVGEDPSLVLDGAGNPRISYYDVTHAALKYAAYNGSTGAWAIQTVDSGGVGRDTSLALDPIGGMPRISYYDETNGDLKYAAYDGSSWHTETVDSPGDVGRYTSLALDRDGRCRISYSDGTNNRLKYASHGGSTWAIGTVDGAPGVGKYTSLALDGDGNPRICYQGARYSGAEGSLKYAWSNSGGFTTETVDPAGIVGRYTSLALDGAGNPCICFVDPANQDLKYARADPPPAPSIDVETEVSVDGGTIWLDADAAPGPSVVAGRPVQWRYIVTNAGNVPLSGVYVEDDRGVPVTAPRTALAAGESMTATYNGTAVAGPHANNGTAYGTAGSQTVQDADGANYLGLALLAVPHCTALPMDTDGDGLYEDVNGNGSKDFADVVLYFNSMTWIAANEPIIAFDCNNNGRVDFADVVWLFNHL